MYIISNPSHTAFYTGVTNNIDRHLAEHKSKEIKGFTSSYNIGTLLYYENFSEIIDATAAKKRIKGWSRAKKSPSLRQKIQTRKTYCPKKNQDPSPACRWQGFGMTEGRALLSWIKPPLDIQLASCYYESSQFLLRQSSWTSWWSLVAEYAD